MLGVMPFVAYMEFGGRSLDPIGRIWRVLLFVFFAVRLWWRELRLGKKMRIGISRNKAVLPISWRLPVLVVLRGARRSTVKLFVKPSRWRLGDGGRSGEVFFNKRVACSHRCTRLLCVSLNLLAGRGGEEEVSGGMTRFWMRKWLYLDAGAAFNWSDISTASMPSTMQAEGQPLHLFGSFSSTTFQWREATQSPRSMAVGQPLPPCSPRCWRRALILQAVVPTRRSSGSETACSRCSTPSGVVPGGGAVDRTRRRCGCGGEGARRDPGPDCFLAVSSRVFFAICQGQVVIPFFYEALSVIVLHRR